MAFSVSPSVIVREVDASASVPAISTPPAAIAGVFTWGPVNDPVLVTSETELVGRFGKPNADNYETFFTAADYLAYANALYVARADDGSTKASANSSSGTDIFEAKYQGALGDSIRVAYTNTGGHTDAAFAVGDILQNETYYVGHANSAVSADAQTFSFNSASIEFQVSAAKKLADGAITTGDILNIGNNTVGYQDLKVATFTESSIDANGAVTAVANNVVGYDYTIAFDGGKYLLSESNPSKIKITKKWLYNGYFNSAPEANRAHIAVVDRDGKITGAADTVIELYENVSTDSTARSENGDDKYWKTVIENQSSWVSVKSAANNTVIASQGARYEDFDGTPSADATSETNATIANIGPAYDTFKNANEIDVSMVLTGKSDEFAQTANYAISNIGEYRKDCVVFCSPHKEATVSVSSTGDQLDNVIAYRNNVQNSSYSFIDSGYKYRYDKYNDLYRWTPLNGDMAGLASRVEVWESPAGYRKGVIKNVIKLAYNPSKAHRDALYSVDVNPVMAQAGQGILLFGDKTGYGVESAFNRLNVRRLFIAVEKAIATAAQGFLFELNDDFTQSQFRNIVDPFLRDIQGRRGIIDYRVISDSTVNTPAVVDQNKFRANIYIQPARSINVIELTFVATRTGVEFDEIVGSIR